MSKSSICFCLIFFLIRAHLELPAAEFTLKNGMSFEGSAGYLSSMDVTPGIRHATGGEIGVKSIVFVNDGLRRTYFSTYQMLPQARESDPAGRIKIRIQQNVVSGVRSVASIQNILKVSRFNEYGRRTFSILTPKGPKHLVQGITEITPLYTRLQGVGKQSIELDMRIATSSIPREILSRILMNRPNANTANGRLEVVRLLFAAERYLDAKTELELAIEQFPEELQEVQQMVEQLKQLSAGRWIDEIELKKRTGQHRRAITLLTSFPEKDVAAEHLARVREILVEYESLQNKSLNIIQQLQELSAEVQDEVSKEAVDLVLAEIESEMNIHNIDRLDDFLRLADDSAMAARQKLGIAISGWIVGKGSTTDNLAVALSLLKVRDLVVDFLRSDDPGRRAEILSLIERQEGGTPRQIARIAANIKPPWTTDPALQKTPGHLTLTTKHGFQYDIQLPDEYDPYHRYPVVLSLHGAGRSASDQINWWCGDFNEKFQTRTGLANRHGYIVMAPHWARPHQTKYEYSPKEHSAVLASLRDACRRFAIDTDRVFLSGLSMGGDAAWDIALSHPDVWAGLVAVVATSDHGKPTSPKYISQYNNHARYVPQYFVMGELDGDRLALNRRDFDFYLSRNGYDTVIVQYIGRGHEHFYDEIHRMFEWMNLHERTHVVPRFECVSRRPTDNFFWCVEVDNLPADKMIHPMDWPKRGTAPKAAAFELRQNNSIYVSTAAAQTTLWLSPEWIDFDRPAWISIGGKKRRYDLIATNADLLFDLRTRADRLHPYWLKIEF